jgi:hypothetical protein
VTVTAFPEIAEARRIELAGPRARALRRAGEALGERLRAAPPVARAVVLPIDRVPCAAHVAFDGAMTAPVRWVTLERRALYLELEIDGRTTRVIVDPVEPGSWARTPWGEWFAESSPRKRKPLARGARTIEDALASIGVARASIDLAIATQLRGQDLRRLVGTSRGDGLEPPRPGTFARWMIPAKEWDGAHAPHDHEKPYLVRHGLDRLDEGVVERGGDVALGASAALIGTPGYTAGHATLFVRTERGVAAWTSHGVAVDAWTPYHARVSGLRERVRENGSECVPRGDAASREDAITSMAFERAVIDRVEQAPAFHLVRPREELAPSALASPALRT